VLSDSEIKANVLQEESDQEEEDEGERQTVPRNKRRLDPFRFFQEMRLLGTSLPDELPSPL
jgi:hypothetical protein